MAFLVWLTTRRRRTVNGEIGCRGYRIPPDGAHGTDEHEGSICSRANPRKLGGVPRGDWHLGQRRRVPTGSARFRARR